MRFVSFFVDGKRLAAPERFRPPDVGNEPVPFYKLPKLDTPPVNDQFTFDHALRSHLSGKLLLLDEIPFPLELLYEHYLNGYLAFEMAIDNEKEDYKCRRCGNKKKSRFASFLCYRCKSDCTYCRKCIVMGRVSQCTPLVRWCGPISHWSNAHGVLKWDGILSHPQQKASDSLVERIGTHDELLIWAVCGAGKTEVLFKGLEKALMAGQRICLATPRTDVVLELLPRLRSVFPSVTLAGLYGGSDQKLEDAQFILSTTHQLFRYCDAFDTIIVDEVDAFPYSMDETLEFAVHQAKKSDALIVYLSATPSKRMKKNAREGKLNHVKIPLRYHGFQLPVPQFVWCGNWKKRLKKGALPRNVMDWVAIQIKHKRQGFLFVPSVTSLKQILAILETHFPGVDGVHAEDPDRKEKVLKFRSGETRILVTTTILERGVTVPFVDVAVLGAEEDIFTESALVQIAGRAGRSKKDPAGDVLFFHYGKSNAMRDSKIHIVQMNKEGNGELLPDV